jgi:hypothetical protein
LEFVLSHISKTRCGAPWFCAGFRGDC